eukprot:354987-Chlamydomonas_euryale.AAC.10
MCVGGEVSRQPSPFGCHSAAALLQCGGAWLWGGNGHGGDGARGTVSVARIVRRVPHTRVAQQDQREFGLIFNVVDPAGDKLARRSRPWRDLRVTWSKLAMSGQQSRGRR